MTIAAKTLRDYQHEAETLLGDKLRHPRLGAVLALTEELGELVKEIMEIEIYNTAHLPLEEAAKAKLSAEAGDILFSLFEVCTAYEIDLTTAYEAKFAKLQSMQADWLIRFGPHLSQLRQKLD